ncbi:LysR family transcriptional regulator [Actibacterium sp. XHP0104]|uniref:LysR family transcriptional regulator n=1 Tax=Actibacterium sp. XHP0104 TaxID=2984335 RepID=UPI0021E748FD|nr:LysR family transcriptional regulator [Actibacterium sp. XHP0104]MCV2880722.1 LysR family transcriptional regulator [Actibacterium sp. XHP0104]
MAIKLEMLRTFRVVAEKGALSQAAAVLGRTPSAVSMTLAQLEANIGAPLFEGDRKNQLTLLGEMVLAEAIRATDVFQTSTDAIRRLTTSIAGTVRIAAVPSATAALLPQALAAFRQTHPGVRLEISDVDSASVRRRVRLEEADIGIVTGAIDDDTDGVAILRDKLGIAFSPRGKIAQAIADGAAPDWTLLGLEPLIGNPLCDLVPHPVVRDLVDSCNLEARNTTALIAFVREGLGATVLPDSLMLNRQDIGYLSPETPVARRELRMISNPERRLNPAAEQLWNALAKSRASGN